MANFDTWRASSLDGTSRTTARAVAAWRRIQDKPTTITILRGAVDLAAQTVRIESVLSPSEQSGGSNAIASVQRVIVFGVADHPTESDTDLKKGDRFVLGGSDEYRIVDVFAYPGELQATAERTR